MASSPNDSLVQSASPNVHQRMLNFMRPEGMSTASPLHIQQTLQAKYRSKLLSYSFLSMRGMEKSPYYHMCVAFACECACMYAT